MTHPDPARQGRLTARPDSPTRPGWATGLQRAGLHATRDALLFVPVTYQPERPHRLVVMLHGAGSNPRHALDPFLDHAAEHDLLLLAPASRGPTWDVIRTEYGGDVAFIDAALHWVFERYALKTAPVVIEGFSDGASYALSLGLTNGDLFTHVIAFAPGFAAPAMHVGAPRVFVAHGTRDTVLPIERCSRVLAPRLQRSGYDVHYQEFDGPHVVPDAAVRDALAWLSSEGA